MKMKLLNKSLGKFNVLKLNLGQDFNNSLNLFKFRRSSDSRKKVIYTDLDSYQNYCHMKNNDTPDNRTIKLLVQQIFERYKNKYCSLKCRSNIQ